MRKSENISKYTIEWQVLRVSLKNKYNDDLVYKLSIVKNYFNKTKSYDRWERVYNWLEGLERGFKTHSKFHEISIIKSELNYYNEHKPDKNYISNEDNSFKDYDLVILQKLWKDLFKTNKNWLDNGYFHKECNDFIDKLYEYLKNKVIFDDKYSYQCLQALRSKSLFIHNKHKFFF